MQFSRHGSGPYVAVVGKSQSDQRSLSSYEEFLPREYVAEYYSELGSENKFLLDFYCDIYRNIPRDARLLEFGGGPTIYQLLSAGIRVKEIVFAEFLAKNRTEVSRWIDADSGAIDWDAYVRYVFERTDDPGRGNSPSELAAAVRDKVTHIIECDARLPDLGFGQSFGRFDVVSSGFCLECISGEMNFLEGCLNRLRQCLAPGGMLVMTALRGASSFKVGDRTFPAVVLTEPGVEALMKRCGYRLGELRSVDAEHDQGYSGLLAFTASV